MIKRESYMARIRPFIDGDLIKVLTGIRRSGKSVMLELIKDELRARGVTEEQLVAFNFEDMRNAQLCTAEALHVVQRLLKERFISFSTRSRKWSGGSAV